MAENDDNRALTVQRARRKRNYALGGLLLFLVVLFFVMTIVRLGGHVS